jgi:long-subunit fatty acid transport protein
VRYAETNATRLSILNRGNPAKQDWHNMFSYAIGANYKQNDTLQWRGGFFYLPYTVPEYTFSPSINDLTRYGIGLGSGIRLTKLLTLDLAYTPTFHKARTIQNTVGQQTTGSAAADVSGEYKGFTHVFTANLVFRI